MHVAEHAPPERRHGGPSSSRVSLARIPPKHWLGFTPPPHQNEGTTAGAASAGATFRVEKVFVEDSEEEAAGDTMEAAGKNHVSAM